MRRTYELAKSNFEEISRKAVEQVMRGRQECASGNLVVTHRWERECIKTDSIWELLSMVIAHVGSVPYLTIIDAASGFIRRKLTNKAAKSVVAHVRQVYAVFGSRWFY